MKAPIPFAVVGLGHIGKRHAEMIRSLSAAQLLAICDIDEAKGADAARWGVPFYSTLPALLEAQPQVEVLCICTPNGMHAQQALLGLEAHKHVVIEKPMAISRADAEQIIYKALQVSKQVFCVMQNRYSPPSAWLKQLVTEERLGKIHLVQINCYWNRDNRYYKVDGEAHPWHGKLELDGGTLFTQFAHFIDTLYWIFGDIGDIQAQFDNFAHQDSIDFEDTGVVNFRLLEGALGVFSYSTAVWDKNMESSLTVLGSKGSIKIGGQYMEKVEYCHVQDYTRPQLEAANPANDYGSYKGSANNHGFVFENVIASLRGSSTVFTNALEGLKVVDVIERIYGHRKLL